VGLWGGGEGVWGEVEHSSVALAGPTNSYSLDHLCKLGVVSKLDLSLSFLHKKIA
jgi:hypothetical protein